MEERQWDDILVDDHEMIERAMDILKRELDKEKIFVRSRSVIGRKVLKCHPEKSAHLVKEIVDGFKNGSMDKAEFWIGFKGDKIHIQYFPVRDDSSGDYLGVLEVTQAIGALQKLTGEKRLL